MANRCARSGGAGGEQGVCHGGRRPRTTAGAQRAIEGRTRLTGRELEKACLPGRSNGGVGGSGGCQIGRAHV